MLQQTRHYTRQQLQEVEHTVLRPERSLQIVLWLVWMLSVAGAALLMWWSAAAASEQIDLLRIVLRSAIVGLLGLIVMSKIEMAAEPWRFRG